MVAYLEFKNAFGAVFIIVLIAGLFYFVYNFIYCRYIDPQFMYKLKDTSVHFMQRMGQSDDKIEQATATIDKEIAASKTFNLGNNVLAYLGSVLIDCLFGLLVAVIVKKNKPVFADQS